MITMDLGLLTMGLGFRIARGSPKKRLNTKQKLDELIKKKILSSMPLMICRYGSVEFSAITTGNNIDSLCNNAGFFPRDEKLLKRFKKNSNHDSLKTQRQLQI